MAGEPVEPPSLSASALVSRLEARLRGVERALLAFDADGTLWTGDVGEDVFQFFTRRGLLRDAAGAALSREATLHGIDASGTPSELGERLFRAYLAGAYPERDVCAMMTWCYAGYRGDELAELVAQALGTARVAERLNRELEPVFEFARRSGVRTVIVSASPAPVVTQAAALWGVAPDDVVACRAAVEDGLVLPRLAAPVPYAEDKPKALAALAEESVVLASFGDNVFDIELLRMAELRVAVRPKPALRQRLAEVPGVVLLEPFAG